MSFFLKQLPETLSLQFKSESEAIFFYLEQRKLCKNNTEADWGSIGLMRNTTAEASTGSLDYMLDTLYHPDSTSTNPNTRLTSPSGGIAGTGGDNSLYQFVLMVWAF